MTAGPRGPKDVVDNWMLERPASLPELVADKLMQSIRTGDLKPGDKIVELQLAKRFNISRAPLREALKSLEAVGLVEIRRNKGTFVTEVSTAAGEELVTMRAGIEGLAARMVACKLTPTMHADLEARLEDMKQVSAQGDVSAWRELDWQFHETICVMAGNAYLLSSWRSISNLVRMFLHNHPGFVDKAASVLHNHDLMLEVLASGDPDHAERTFRRIILTSGFTRLGKALPPAFAALDASPVTAAQQPEHAGRALQA